MSDLAHGPDDLAAVKAAARQRAIVRRATYDPHLAQALPTIVFAECPPPAGAVIAGFWPIGTEIDIRPLLAALARQGHTLCLPETPKRGLPLMFRRWHPDDPLIQGRFGTYHPACHPTDAIIEPDVILTPLLAFDRTGRRLGYGAGYYDRTLAAMPYAFRLGCAYAAQEIEAVPAGRFDQALDAIATEKGVMTFDRSSLES